MSNNKLVWTTELRKVNELKAYEHNPRQITESMFEKLKNSIDEIGYVELVAIDQDNVIIAGHMRVRALIALGRGEEEIEVRVPNRKLTKKEFDKYLIVSNKVTGDWSYDMLNNVFDIGDLKDWGFTLQQLGMHDEQKKKDQTREDLNNELDNIMDTHRAINLYILEKDFDNTLYRLERIQQFMKLGNITEAFMILLAEFEKAHSPELSKFAFTDTTEDEE